MSLTIVPFHDLRDPVIIYAYAKESMSIASIIPGLDVEDSVVINKRKERLGAGIFVIFLLWLN